MKYKTPKLYTFGLDVKFGNDCSSGSSADQGDSDNCTTGGGAKGGCWIGNMPGRSDCATGNVVSTDYCWYGNGVRTPHHQ